MTWAVLVEQLKLDSSSSEAAEAVLVMAKSILDQAIALMRRRGLGQGAAAATGR
jgi:hypothetical protein